MSDSTNRPKSTFTSQRPTGRSDKKAVFHSRLHSRDFVFIGAYADDIQNAIATVCSSGDLISFALTGDGGALSITIVQDDVRHKAYAKHGDAVSGTLRNLLDEVYGV